MAARRVSASTVNWAEFARKIPAAQKPSFNALKKSDGFVRAVNALPEAAPKIDFAAYKSKVAVDGMVDDFQKKYEALDIPYPKDNVSASLDTLLATKKSEYEKFVADSKVKIGEIEVELAKWEKMRPIEEMNKEEIVVQMPHLCTDLGVRDPAQHGRKFMSLDTKFEQTYDDFMKSIKMKLDPRRGLQLQRVKNEQKWRDLSRVWISKFIWRCCIIVYRNTRCDP